jgi:hypothetical protein
MATRWAVQNGNWSDTATWDGGTLPDVGDDVYADGKNVTIDQNVTVLTIRNTQRTGGTDGGTFTVTGDYTINADLRRGNISMMTYNGTGTLNINGSTFTDVTTNTGRYVLTHSGTGTINLVGNINVNLAGSNSSHIIVTSSGIINFTGNTNAPGGGAANSAFILESTSRLNFTGNITRPSIGTTASGVLINIGTNAKCYFVGISENCSGTTYSIFLNANYLNFDGVINALYALASRPTIQDSGTTAITIFKGDINCSDYGDFPLLVRRIFYTIATNTVFDFASSSTDGAAPPSTAPTRFPLYSADVVIDAPNIGDVRENVVYADGILTGTLAVPDPADVRRSVPTDNTVGTADLTAQDFFDAIATSNDPVAIRLRNVATVETTGDQISAFNV